MLQRVGETADPKDAVVKIKDACFPAPFASELEYNSPVHGNWNIVHTDVYKRPREKDANRRWCMCVSRFIPCLSQRRKKEMW